MMKLSASSGGGGGGGFLWQHLSRKMAFARFLSLSLFAFLLLYKPMNKSTLVSTFYEISPTNQRQNKPIEIKKKQMEKFGENPEQNEKHEKQDLANQKGKG